MRPGRAEKLQASRCVLVDWPAFYWPVRKTCVQIDNPFWLASSKENEKIGEKATNKKGGHGWPPVIDWLANPIYRPNRKNITPLELALFV